MEVKLLGALEYKEIEKILGREFNNIDEIIAILKKNEVKRKTQIISTAARLSRSEGKVFDVLELSANKGLDQNIKYIERVIDMGHDSILDHDYCIFAIKDASAIIEQTVIAERYSSFTVKSRREVDFATEGYYIPDFRDKNNKIIENNNQVKKEYQDYMSKLFKKYSYLIEQGISKEDARFVLPYSFHSTFIMGVDAHTLKDMIIKYTKTKYSKISEINELGNKLYEIAKEHMPYIISQIDKAPEQLDDRVDLYLSEKVENKTYEVIDRAKILTHTSNIDDTILLTAIKRRYQLSERQANEMYKLLCKDPNFKKELMYRIAFESDALELTQVNFQIQIPTSFAVLTHFTRHRAHNIVVPDFCPVVDLSKYKVPPKILRKDIEYFRNIFCENKLMYEHFKNDYGIREEDLIYFTLSGNMINIITNINGKELKHILELRECNKSQWETRNIAVSIHKEISGIEDAKNYSSILGPSCVTQGICKEKQESCGKVLTLIKN